ncbi:MAG: type II toxin-antitoxin system RelE/ParE family toxin [Nitrosomonas sp.]|uniref:type II toxin-antitoxin system RelE/ParE family toxin n=1 Tax=Nitrosomonas sp. TaxID=42353 RepID=UPI0025E6A350|nr:type II toxin-antitoxin system RelE/ParE family toxin [Nitrosomonas sp.]MBY0475043.1 type II toxin-antitoxin system RelE/ParE family toxin [Nitrosomonas sp.]
MVVWTESAKADLRAIHDFIAHDSCYYAKKVTQDIREKMDGLDEFQKMGRIVPEINDDLVRELSLYSYRIIYEIKDQTIFILAVVHQRRNLKGDDVSREAS